MQINWLATIKIIVDEIVIPSAIAVIYTFFGPKFSSSCDVPTPCLSRATVALDKKYWARIK